MSARTAKKEKAPERWSSPFIDGGFTTNQAEATVRTGPPEEQVMARVELGVSDGPASRNVRDVNILWTVKRIHNAGKVSVTNDYPDPHTDICFRSDEIEAFANALYEAVKLAKKQGYLPTGAS